MPRTLLPALLGLLAPLASAPAATAPHPGGIDFRRDVLPILAENCFSCHGFDRKSRKADLRLDTREGATATTDGVTAIVPGQPDASELIARIFTDDADDLMPPKKSGKHLKPGEKETLRRWVAAGAEYRKHWAFEMPQRPEPPAIAGASQPIDRFLQARLAGEKLTPSPRAEAATLIRRVSLDLTGLPPSPAEVDAFVAAAAADFDPAWSALVERLLASPHYGERWARWWLDQARYADSNGYSVDAPRQIWRYRDWVIAALNADLPFDQFTIEQLAGDLLPQATIEQKIATGFHRNTQLNQEGGIDREQFRIDSVFDRVATTGTVWLGLTVGCAQCHDHKFDPIEQKEFYRLFAFFNDQEEPALQVPDPTVDRGALTAELREVKKKLTLLVRERAEEIVAWDRDLAPEFRKKLTGPVQKALAQPVAQRTLAEQLVLFGAITALSDPLRVLSDRHKELDTALNQGPTTLVLQERPQPRKTTLFINGDFTRPAEEVAPGTLAVLHPLPAATGRGSRLDLARWIVSPENPLTARVLVNRLWQQYFGRGLVETENDFGLIGAPPSHPELLDWLAVEFMDRKWSLKAMHRLIVGAHAYRQSSVARPELREKDAHNFLLARQTRLRLDGEIVRDVALAASGLLAPKLGGPPVFPPIPEGVMGQGQVKRTWTVSPGEDRYRRGLYTFVYRATPPPGLSVFDAPDGFSSCTRRNRSNTPLQALTLMNDTSFFECATALEKILQRDGLTTAFRRCTGRHPKPAELAVLTKLAPLTAARALLNLDETITRE